MTPASSKAKKALVIGNWKMYIDTPSRALELVSALKRKARSFGAVEVVVAPPFPFIPTIAHALRSSTIGVAAQALSPSNDEKRTGEVSGVMVAAAGASYVLVGHSERRAQGETNETIARQAERAIEANLQVVLCVGEEVRDSSGGHFSVIESQLREGLRHIKQFGTKVIVAYEPVWAIGKSAKDAMNAQELEESVIFIRKTLAELFPRAVALKVPILYGGSVEKENAEALMRESGIAGFLVGHASVDAASFIEIIGICSKKS